jgi:methanogenic corrinoid protein MtbC1
MGSFGTNLKEIRKSRKISQKQLAEHIGVGQTTIANYESDQRFPNPIILSQIAHVLNTSVDKLIETPVEFNPVDDINAFNQEVLNLILNNKDSKAKDMVMGLLKRGYQVLDLYDIVLRRILYMVGEMWQTGEISIPMEHHVTHIIDQLIVLLSPHKEVKGHSKKTVTLIAPSNEEHLIGLKIIKEIFTAYGWTALFIGNSVPWQSLTETIVNKKIDLVVITSTIPSDQNQVAAMIDHIKSKVKAQVMVGGQAFENNNYSYKHLNADYFILNKDSLYQFLKNNS